MKTSQRLLFNGKEVQDGCGLGWYDYGARFYDPDVPHFPSPDPKAEKFPSTSPHAYVLGNPVMNTDPTGMEAQTAYDQERDKDHAEMKEKQAAATAAACASKGGDPSQLNNGGGADAVGGSHDEGGYLGSLGGNLDKSSNNVMAGFNSLIDNPSTLFDAFTTGVNSTMQLASSIFFTETYTQWYGSCKIYYSMSPAQRGAADALHILQ